MTDMIPGLVPKVKALRDEFRYAEARLLLQQTLATLADHPDKTWCIQQLAFCTYKDEELLPAFRFDKALAILEGIGLRDTATDDPETLALGGAIYKRRWEYGGQLEHLFNALHFYRAAFERNPDQDAGYGGINAAYILDVLAARAARTDAESIEARQCREQAWQLRVRIAEVLNAKLEQDNTYHQQYWFAATLAEAYFGMGDYEQAQPWLNRCRALKPDEWEQQTTFRQLVSIARLHDILAPPENSRRENWHRAWQVLACLLAEENSDNRQAQRAFSCYRGKVGLALSGGGFRASLFHLGVLARLAEVDALRGIDVLATVSGGSIVGAHYYLEVKKLLESKADGDIGKQDYIDLVARLQKNFIAGVKTNIRTRIVSNLVKNIRLLFSITYSRSNRLGELYEQELYARVEDGHPSGQPRRMRDLLIAPVGERPGKDFKPRFSNWRRGAKVPILQLNATSLNSGHSWLFTATTMGEPPRLLSPDIDKNPQYPQVRYDQDRLAEHLRNFRLGDAVAASACVPALFEPLVIKDLYKDRLVRLVDGGVHDNQGVQGLLSEGCELILCSDAVGQMDEQPEPSNSLLGVPLRANSILMNRVREAQYQDMAGRVDSFALNGFFFVHLRQQLPVKPVSICGQESSSSEAVDKDSTPYGIAASLQQKLSNFRTDLDAFSDIEANALMLSGYLTSEYQLKVLQEQHAKSGAFGNWGDFDIAAPRGKWEFLTLETLFGATTNREDPKRKSVEKHLDAAQLLFFKPWKVDPLLAKLRWGLAVLAVLMLSYLLVLIHRHWDTTLAVSGQVGIIALSLAMFLIGIVAPAIKWFMPGRALKDIIVDGATRIVFALGGWIGSNFYLYLLHKRFLKAGELRHFVDNDGFRDASMNK